MKKTIMTAIIVCTIGCGEKADAKTPVVKEIASTANIIIVPNTKHIDYATYRQEWRKVNNKPAPRWAPDVTATLHTTKDAQDTHEIVEIGLSELDFKDAFRIEFLGKGEGHVFWWRGKEYTTNLLDVVRKPKLNHDDPYIKRVSTLPVGTEDLREGGGDQGTTEE